MIAHSHRFHVFLLMLLTYSAAQDIGGQGDVDRRQVTECASDSSDSCQDSTVMLQSKANVDVKNVPPIFDTIDKNNNDKIERQEFDAALDGNTLETPLFGSVDANDDA